MNEQSWLIAVILVGSLAGAGGLYYGRSLEQEAWERLIYRADLSPECEQKLRDANQELNEETAERKRLTPDRY
jgi:hypothetical protein